MMLAVKSLFFLMMLALTSAQIPSLGWCPDYQAMPNFNLNDFLGTWHEAERYFTVTELGSRCVTTTYEKLADGRIIVHNEIRSALTGVKRVLDGQLQHVGRDGEGKLAVKYLSFPVNYDTQYTVLDTDYKSFAVLWSCSGIGPVNTQNAWVMTRDRLAPGAVMQRAYGVLDKFKISRAFFVKTGQEDCTIQGTPIDVIDPPAAAAPSATKSVDGDQPAVEEKKEEAAPAIKAEPEVKPDEPIPQVKSALPVAEVIISNAEANKPDEPKEQVAQKVESENPPVLRIEPAADPKPAKPEQPPVEAPIDPAPEQKSAINEIVKEEPSKPVDHVDPKPEEQKNEEAKA